MKSKRIKTSPRLWHHLLKGYASIFDFTGHQVRQMFPDAFGYGEDTVTASWKSVGDQIRKSMQPYSPYRNMGRQDKQYVIDYKVIVGSGEFRVK